MEIECNSRQMPKTKEYMSNKKYHDVVYGWLQVNSFLDSNCIRWISKKSLNFSAIAREIKLSRQTVAAKFNNLIELGLVIFNEDQNRYELRFLPRETAMLIECETLRKMVAVLNENTINIFIYLLNRYIANSYCAFYFSLDQVKKAIGISEKSKNNGQVILDILDILEKLGLLSYTQEQTVSKGKTVMMYRILTISNRIEKKKVVKNLGSEKLLSC